MYPIDPTHTEELIKAIEANKPPDTQIIRELIDNHDTSKMLEGIRYYFNQSDIVNRKIYTYENDKKVVDEDATNNKLPASWHKRLVDQKVSYLAGKAPTLTSEEEDDPNQEAIEEKLGDEFEDTIPELIKHASNKGIEWLHVYVDENGNFDYMIVPAQEFIPIYDNTKRKNLIGGIRVYPIDENTEKIEFWDTEYVTFYERIDGGEIVKDVDYDENPQSHFYYGSGDEKKGYSWSKDDKKVIPYIPFRNNEEEVNDLTFYKALIDGFEIVTSDVTNTLEDMQSIVWVLRGYEGTDLQTFNNDLKRYKVVSLSDEPGSGFDAVRAEIPTDAVDSYLDRTAQLIYEAGQGVQISQDQLGQNPTGVSLKFLYTALDMKCQVLERKFSKALKELLWFICEYLNMTDNLGVDYKNYSFVFNKTMITNATEQIENSNASAGMISDETRLANHPWVEDVQMELERIQQQQDEYMRNMPNVGEGEE